MRLRNLGPVISFPSAQSNPYQNILWDFEGDRAMKSEDPVIYMELVRSKKHINQVILAGGIPKLVEEHSVRFESHKEEANVQTTRLLRRSPWPTKNFRVNRSVWFRFRKYVSWC